MSRVEFFTKEGLEVGGGWDPPLQYFFITIFDKDQEVLADQNAPTTEPLKKLLDEHEIVPPEGFWELVESQENGSTVHRWSDKKGDWFKRW